MEEKVKNAKTINDFLGLKLEDRFWIITKVDKGAHGQIMQARDLNDNKDVAIKFMPRDERHKNKFTRELNVFKKLSQLGKMPIGFPRLIYHGHTPYWNYYVMEMLGWSLKKVQSKAHNNRLSLKHVIQIGLQLTDRLELLHNVGLIHRDLKPANIVFGLDLPEDTNQEKSNILYLIDYGLTKEESINMIPKISKQAYLSKNLRLTGTPIYASVHAHIGTNHWYRKDDMESLVYVLIHLFNGTVPWQFVEVSKEDNFVNIMNYKRTATTESLAEGMPKGFAKIVDYIRSLKFLDVPDYDYLRYWLLEIASSNDIQLDGEFDWEADIKKRTSRNRLKSKSSKNLSNQLLHNKSENEEFKRNNSLNKKRVICDMVKPLAKSRWFKVWTNSETVGGRKIFTSKLGHSSNVENAWFPRGCSSTSLLYNKLQRIQSNHVKPDLDSEDMSIPWEYSEGEQSETETFVEFQAVVRNSNCQYTHANNVYDFGNNDMNLKNIWSSIGNS